jgi:hypothetical protein
MSQDAQSNALRATPGISAWCRLIPMIGTQDDRFLAPRKPVTAPGEFQLYQEPVLVMLV